jgi:hypothetical protein
MATKCRAVDHKKLESSDTQTNPNLGCPEDLEIIENGAQAGGDSIPCQAKCGKNAEEYNRLGRPNRDHGKSFRTTPRDFWGRLLAG